KNEVLPSRYKIISIGKLQQIDFNLTEEIKQIDNSEFSLIIIDEAHNFRNKNANRTIKLKELLAHRRLSTHLLLVTATPINTSLDNLTSLLNLAQYGEYSTVLNSLGINAIVQALTKKISKNQVGNKEVYTLLKDLLNKVVIRITWSDIPQRFEQDLTRLKFDKFELPTVSSIRYTYDKKIKERIFDQIVPFLEKLNFEYTKLWDGEYFEDKNLIFWYKWRLYKRLESSIAAFLDSINRFKARNEYLLENLDKSNKAETALFDKERLKAIFVAYNGQQQNRKNEIKKRIKSDIDLLNKMINTIEGLRIDDPEVDSKLQKLIKIIKDEGLGRDNPAIIFSESKSTVIYLASKLKDLGLKIKPVFGGELEESEMEEMFGEISKKEINKIKIMDEFERGEYDILITTDILSEGVNLPRANVVINYDIPYNPVKLIQRDGRPLRINAIKKTKIFNFVPEKNIDKELELFKILKERINTIISIFGLDFMIWSLSRLNRKPNLIDLEKLYSEYKEALSTQNPEELNKEIYWGEEGEDKVLIQFINKYNISKETVEAQQISKQLIYTVLRSGKHSFFALFEKGQKYTVGELNFGESTEETRKETLTDEEI
ncbi:MAG: helicase-related protein, partial [Minisyncoccia bacterium]